MNDLLFRLHRGTLDESMKTVIKMPSMEELIFFLYTNCDLIPSELVIKKYVYDERIGWDTYIVIITVANNSYPIGYLNRNPTEWKDISIKGFDNGS